MPHMTKVTLEWGTQRAVQSQQVETSPQERRWGIRGEDSDPGTEALILGVGRVL